MCSNLGPETDPENLLGLTISVRLWREGCQLGFAGPTTFLGNRLLMDTQKLALALWRPRPPDCRRMGAHCGARRFTC